MRVKTQYEMFHVIVIQRCVCNVGSQNRRGETPQKLMVKLNKYWMGG